MVLNVVTKQTVAFNADKKKEESSQTNSNNIN